MSEYKVQYESVGLILGGRPQEDVSEGYLRDLIEGTLGEKFRALTDDEKVKEMKEWKKKTITVFRRMPNGQLALGAVQLKAAMKEVSQIFGLKLKQQLQHGIWVTGVNVDGEEFLPLFRNGKPVMKPDGYKENFIPPTFTNPKACIKVWERLNPGVTFEATLQAKSPKLDEPALDKLTNLVDAIGSGRGQQDGRIKRNEFKPVSTDQ